jgi:hypothetical protein
MSFPSSSRILCENIPRLPSLSPPPETSELLSPIALSSHFRGRSYGDLSQYPSTNRRRIAEKYAEAFAMIEAASIFEIQTRVLEELLIVTEHLRQPKPKTIKKPRRGEDPSYPILIDDDQQMAVPSHPLPSLHIPPILCQETLLVQTNLHTIQEYRRWWEDLELNALALLDLSPFNHGSKKRRDQRIEVPAPGAYPGTK